MRICPTCSRPPNTHVTIGDLRRAIANIDPRFDYVAIAIDRNDGDGTYMKVASFETPPPWGEEGDYETLTLFYDTNDEHLWDVRFDT